MSGKSYHIFPPVNDWRNTGSLALRVWALDVAFYFDVLYSFLSVCIMWKCQWCSLAFNRASVHAANLWVQHTAFYILVDLKPKTGVHATRNSKMKILFEYIYIHPSVSQRTRSWHLDVKGAGSKPPTAGQLSHLAPLFWPWPPSRKMVYIVIPLIKKIKNNIIK